MKAERAELALRVFPQLRSLCETRDVTWKEVDLRWGITEEQAAKGLTLPLCLDAVARCRPYFIGLLGERYGTAISNYSKTVLQHEPWLREHLERGTSLTELEICHGVLNDPSLASHAFFYFRDPLYVNNVPEGEQNDFIPRNSDDALRQATLKRRIREAGMLVRESYCNPRELGELVLRDFKALIVSLFPEARLHDARKCMRRDHDKAAESKCDVYIERQEYFDRLDSFAASNSTEQRPLIVLGASGAGKSALLANWVRRFESQHPKIFLFAHFVGSSYKSTDPIILMRRILFELKNRFELEADIPSDSTEIYETVPRWLADVTNRGRIVLVLDAINQIEDRDNAQHLGWLPNVFPPNIRLIISSLSGPNLDALDRRGWLRANEPLTVQPLTEDERRLLIRQLFEKSGRELSPGRVDKLVSATATASPLFLRAVLDELRVIGEHHRLDEQIDDYLSAPDPKALYSKIINRWISVYSEGRDLVARSLQLIWASRRGLSETELLDLLGKDDQPLPRALWTPFLLAAMPTLVARSGLLSFAHPHIREACSITIVQDDAMRQTAHCQLADYFGNRVEKTLRKAEEWPWHLLQARRHNQLIDALVGLWSLRSLAKFAYDDILVYWRSIAGHVDLEECYESAWALVSNETNHGMGEIVSEYAHTIGRILEDCGYWHKAATFYERFLSRRVKERKSQGLSVQIARRSFAACLARLGEHAKARPLLHAALDELTTLVGPHHPSALETASDLACLLQHEGDFDGAQNLHYLVLEASGWEVRPSRPAAVYALAFAGFLETCGEKQDALKMARSAAASLAQILGPTAHQTLMARLHVSRLECELHDNGQGPVMLSSVASALVDLLGSDHPDARMAVATSEKWWPGSAREAATGPVGGLS